MKPGPSGAGGFLPDVEFQPVVKDLVAHGLGNRELERLDPFIRKFNDFAGIHVDHMIVVRRLGMFEAGGGAFELVGAGSRPAPRAR